MATTSWRGTVSAGWKACFHRISVASALSVRQERPPDGGQEEDYEESQARRGPSGVSTQREDQGLIYPDDQQGGDDNTERMEVVKALGGRLDVLGIGRQAHAGFNVGWL